MGDSEDDASSEVSEEDESTEINNTTADLKREKTKTRSPGKKITKNIKSETTVVKHSADRNTKRRSKKFEKAKNKANDERSNMEQVTVNAPDEYEYDSSDEEVSTHEYSVTGMIKLFMCTSLP